VRRHALLLQFVAAVAVLADPPAQNPTIDQPIRGMNADLSLLILPSLLEARFGPTFEVIGGLTHPDFPDMNTFISAVA